VIDSVLFLGFVSGSAWFDLRTGEIPEWLIVLCLLVGFVFSLVSLNVFGLVLTILVYYVFFVINKLGLIGGGDTLMFPGLVLLKPEPFFLSSVFLVSLFNCACFCLAFKKKVVRFFPFLLVSTLILFFFGFSNA